MQITLESTVFDPVGVISLEALPCVTAGSFSRSTFQRFTHRWT
jgi:hypothetical protein